MEIIVHWYYASNRSSKLDWYRVLYAYLHPDSLDILYIGKAYHCSVRERLRGEHKENIYDWLHENYGINRFKVLVGVLESSDIGRLTQQIITDVESLLIKRLQPPCNVMSIKIRNYTRPGLKLYCKGDWPHDRSSFYDRG